MHDLKGVLRLLEAGSFDAPIGDKAFDAGWLAEEIESQGAVAVIPSRSNRKVVREHDRAMYGWQHQVENFFLKIKEFHVVATRCCKTITSFRAAIVATR